MSSGLASDTKHRVKQATDITDLVGSYMPLRRSGSNYVCHCPWHDDKRPSLQVNPARQSFVCWVCDIRGDVFDFVMRREGVEFVDALKILAERAGIPLTFSQKKIVKGSADDKHALYRTMNWAAARYHNFLLESDAAAIVRKYLVDRKISDECVKQFQIGFAPVAYTWLVDQARNTEFSPELMEACGLISRSQRGSWYERFRGRLMFPILDTMQRPIALGGRIVPGVFEPDKEPPGKYVNSPETRLFSKSETLYGLNVVRDKVAKRRELTIVEGYTDVVAAWQAGLENVVACLGTALNQKHIQVIKRFADQITLVLDGDEAGRKRANEVLDLFVANDIDLRILSLPDGADPFDFLQQNGAEPFQALVDQAADAIDHKIKIETAGIDLANETHRANQALENILATLARVPAGQFAGSTNKVIRQDQLLGRLARRFAVDREQLKKRVVELRSKLSKQSRNYGPEPQQQPLPSIDYSKLVARESWLLQLVMREPEFLDVAVENISPEQFVPGPLKALFEEICVCFNDGEDATYEALMLRFENGQQKNLLSYLDEEWDRRKTTEQAKGWESVQTPLEQLNEIIASFSNMEEAKRDRQKINELQQTGTDEQEELKALEELLEQQKRRHGQ